MVLSKILEKINRLKPNALSDTDLVDIVNELEAEIAIEVLKLDEYQLASLDNSGVELLAPKPYDGVYYDYLCAVIDRMSNNLDGYSMTYSQFNANYAEMKAYCMREGLTSSNTIARSEYF